LRIPLEAAGMFNLQSSISAAIDHTGARTLPVRLVGELHIPNRSLVPPLGDGVHRLSP
jgi:hypothetical protein